MLIRARGRRDDVGGFLDSAIFTASLAVLAWALLAHPTIQSYQQSAYAAAVGAAYPFADIVLLGLLIRLVTTPGGRTWSFRLLVVAVLALVVADVAATALDMSALTSSAALEPLWLLSYAAWGAAALTPSMVSLTEPAVGLACPAQPDAVRAADCRWFWWCPPPSRWSTSGRPDRRLGAGDRVGAHRRPGDGSG